MSMLVSYTQTPMVLDAVGALKVTHYYGRSALDDVYTYLRAFVLRGDLIFSLTAFEQTPPAESRIAVAFRFLPEKDPFFYLTVGPACPVEAFLSGSNGMVSLSLPQQGNRFGGSLGSSSTTTRATAPANRAIRPKSFFPIHLVIFLSSLFCPAALPAAAGQFLSNLLRLPQRVGISLIF